MENLSLVIVTDDREYGRALGQAMLHLCSQIFVHIIGKEEFFLKRREAYGDEAERRYIESADMILWDGHEAEGAYGGRIVLLSDKPAMAVKNFAEKKFCIYRYSPAQTIIASLFEIYSFLTGRKAVNIRRQTVNVLAFSSWSGGAGCTTVAMAVAQELCRFRGKRVMYISLEEVESTGEFIESPPGVKGAGVYLYHLFKTSSLRVSDRIEDGRGYPIMESYIVRDGFGLEAFAPTRGRNPLKSLSDEEMDIFIASLIDSGRYDVIIMDLGNCISGISVSCMEIAEKICFVSRSGDKSGREEQYLQYLMCICGEGIVEKILKAENMADNEAGAQDASGENQGMLETASYIGKTSAALRQENVRRIFLDGKFGNSIRALTEKLMESA